jgi:hypothetical protein
LGRIPGELGMISLAIEPVRKEIDEERAAALLGLTRAQLRELCEQSGLGRGAAGETSEQKLFTYEELYRLCRWVARTAV